MIDYFFKDNTYNHLITILNINLCILEYKYTSPKQYNCFIEQKLLFRTINKKKQITTNLYNTIQIFFLFWKITICWRLMNLMNQFSIMGPTVCKQNNIQLQYRHTQANRILIRKRNVFYPPNCLLNLDSNICYFRGFGYIS